YNGAARTSVQQYGPSVTDNGWGLLDPRYPYRPGAQVGTTRQGTLRAWFAREPYALVDAAPTVLSDARIAANQTPASGTNMTLVSADVFPTAAGRLASLVVGVPLVPFGQAVTAANVVTVLALDAGAATGATTSGSATVSTVTTVSTAAILTMDPTGTTVAPYLRTGVAWMFDPTQAVARTLIATNANSGDDNNTVTVNGYDVYGQAMTQTLTLSNATPATSTKAFKYIRSATPTKSGGGNFAGNVKLGTQDVFGLSFAADRWDELDVYWASAAITASTGFTAAVRTSPATATTGDVRGTYAVQSTAADSQRRLVINGFPGLSKVFASDGVDSSPLLGVTQV
ncbi:MAG: hypothetical protein EBZ69_07890, partial [Alphaproteobacteria bacterium]|nr:hypothetical protein [Alphaproteobacteria bacterium]